MTDEFLEELYVERHTGEQLVGNIYKGRISNVEPAIQACFVDIGIEKNGFLHASDIIPSADVKRTKTPRNQDNRRGQKRSKKREEYPIADLVKKGQEIMVQVTKERLNEKGPGLTNYISLPGRYLVMMPEYSGTGVSRKIADDEERRNLKERLTELNPPEEHGFIVRTAGMEVTKRDMQRDLKYLMKVWNVIEERVKKGAPILAYEESDIVIRTIRDIFTAEIDEIIIDAEDKFLQAKEFLQYVSPRHASRVKLYAGKTPLFHRFSIESQVENIYSATVPLKSGGSIVIQQTEALVAIDINSGKFTDESDPEITALKINKEAAIAITRQLRLRDLGGVIVIDFIDMRQEKNRKEIEKILYQELKKDRAKAKALRMSRFCLVEMTRQRMRSSLKRASHDVCPLCSGHGTIKNIQSVALYVMRKLRFGLNHKDVSKAQVLLNADVASYIQNRKRRELVSIENLYKKSVEISTNGFSSTNELELSFFNKNGQKVLVK